MKKTLFILILFCSANIMAQGIGHYNQYPTLHHDTYLDLNGVSFAYSLRLLDDSYTGPIVNLRRSSDNATRDFYSVDNDIIDITGITNWGGASTLYVTTWYDQSTAGRNAIQTNVALQPQLILTNPIFPEIDFDGIDDYLRVNNGNIQDVTNAGKEGSVFVILKATRKSQISFGVLSGSNRWSAHLNWGNDNAYFDPGNCCNPNRDFFNNTFINTSAMYTLIAGSNSILARRNNTEVLSGAIASTRCTLTYDFLIGAGSSGNTTATGYSNSSFTEMIMFNTNVPENIYSSIEDNQLNFWGL